jgi:mannose-6-phosphate isomerase-like protein (cupin superfamily)
MTPPTGYMLGRDHGEALWFLGTRMTVKAAGEATRGALTLIECECPAGFAPPPHIHHAEDEAFYLLDGRLDVTCGDSTWILEPGGFAFLPKGTPHRFVVSADGPARMLQLTAPSQFEHFAAESGARATGPGLPEPGEPDIERLLLAASRHHIEILPPPTGR